MDIGDDALMLRFKAGDTAAFDALYARHKGPLYRYFLRQTARDAVDDLFQDTWTRVVKGAERYVSSAPFAAYLYRIAHNVLVDHYRRTGRMPEHVDADGLDPPDLGPGPASIHDRDALRARITEALTASPAPQREAFLLHQEGELTLDQIAEVVGANRETVKSRLRYAVKRLKSALRDEAAERKRRA